jgi:HK97 family phage major capsid protein
MNKLTQLKADRAAKIAAQKALIDTRNTANRDFTEDETTQFRALTTEIEAFQSSIDLEQEVVEAQARAASSQGVSVPGGTKPKGEEAEKSDIHARASILGAIRNAKKGAPLEGATKELDEIGREQNRLAGITTNDNAVIVIPMATRADQQSVTLDSGEYGGQLVQNQAPRVQDPFTPKLFLEELGATLLTGLTGGSIPMPNANNFDFAWLAEGAEAAKQKQKFVGPSLVQKRASTVVEITNTLINQSSIGVEQLIRNLLMQGASRILNSAAINGPGTNAPTGILNTTGISTGSSTAATAATYALIAELEALIDTDDVSDVSRGWLMHPKVKAALRTIKLDTGSGLFLLNSNEEFQGYKYASTNLIPTLDAGGTDVYPLIFGDFSQLFVGQFGAMSLVVDPYSLAGAGSVRIIPEMFAGVAIPKPNAFAANSFITGV